MNSKFYNHLLEHYVKDLFYIKINKTLNKKAFKDGTKFSYVKKEKLIFCIKKRLKKKIYVFLNLAKDIFDVMHD